MPVTDIYAQGDTFNLARCVWVMDETTVDTLVAAIETSQEVVWDTETTGLNEHAVTPVKARLAMATFTLPQEHETEDPVTWILPLAHPESPFLGTWRSVLNRVANSMRSKPQIGQNIKFDFRWMYRFTGVDLSPWVEWDTQVGSHLLDENVTTSLKPTCERVFGVPRWDDHDLSTPGAALRVPMIELGEYAARDTYWTWRLSRYQRSVMEVGEYDSGEPPLDRDEAVNRGLGRLAVWCSGPTVSHLSAMEMGGIRLDLDWVDARLKTNEETRLSLYSELVDRYDSPELRAVEPSFAATSRWFKAWTQAAVDAGDLRVAALTGTGAPQWNKAVLQKQALNGSPVAASLLEMRRMVKQQEYLRSWLANVSEDGYIHAMYNVGRRDRDEYEGSGGTDTGRLSSSNPNMQQVTAELKPAYTGREGYYIAECDFSQIELRITAHVAPCEPMAEAFRKGLDLHKMLAAQITGKSISDVSKTERQGGKAGNFGFVFGMQAEGFQTYAESNYGVEFSIEEAMAVREGFFSLWDGLAEWHHRQTRIVQRDGQVVSPLGRVRRLPHVWDGNPSRASHAERQAINSPVQSMASDLMQMAAASVAGRLPGYDPVPGVRAVGTVHDSLVVEVPADDWKRSTARVMHRMLNLHPVLRKFGCDFQIPLGVESKVGTRWGLSDVGVITS